GERHGEAHIRAGRTLASRPLDESLEAVNRARWRRDEARHFFSRQQGEERRRVGGPHFAQHHRAAHQHWQLLAPAAADRFGGRRPVRRGGGATGSLQLEFRTIGHFFHGG